MGRGLDVATIKLPYVQSFIDRHGTPRHYYRRGDKRVPLPGSPGSAEFMEAYAAAQGAPIIKASGLRTAPEGTFSALALIYYTSPEFKALRASSQAVYRGVIDGFLMNHGQRRVDQMQRKHVKAIIGDMADRPAAAGSLLKRIRTLIRCAIDLDWITVDPTTNIKTFRGGEHHTWTEEEIAQFEAHWPAGSRQRLGFALHLFTGQRCSDVHRMTWADISSEAIRVVQVKTGAKLLLRLHPDLLSVLSHVKREHVAIITTDHGKTYTAKGFGRFMAKAIEMAGLPARCVPHGLRKAAARRLAEAGCTPHEIMSVTGHTSIAEVERYTRAAAQKGLNENALAKQVANAGLSNLAEPTVNPAWKAAENKASR